MSEATWNKGLSDAAAGVHHSGQDADYECGWHYGQLPDSLEDQLRDVFPEYRYVPPGCIEVIDEEVVHDGGAEEESGDSKPVTRLLPQVSTHGALSGERSGTREPGGDL